MLTSWPTCPFPNQPRCPGAPSGPIPCDFEMDIVVPVWLNPSAFGCPDPPAADQPADPPRSPSVDPSLALRCGKTRSLHVERAGLWLDETFRPRVLQRRDWGGWRVNLAWIRVDLIVSIDDNSSET